MLEAIIFQGRVCCTTNRPQHRKNRRNKRQIFGRVWDNFRDSFLIWAGLDKLADSAEIREAGDGRSEGRLTRKSIAHKLIQK